MYFSKLLKYMEYGKRIIKFIILFFPAYVYSFFIKNKASYNGIWLISERGDEARDNGYHLYGYIKENYKNINAFFVITNDSPDIKKVEKYGGLITPNSFKHFLLFILSEKLISTHFYGAAPYGKASKFFLWLLPKKQHIFLQHGITQNKYLVPDINDLIICSSDLEVKVFSDSSKKVLDSIKVTGLCRYDKLINLSNNINDKIILFMPTFRMWLEETSRLKNRDEIFMNDPYYIYWNDLLNDVTLNKYCQENGYQIIFYPHYRSQKYLHNFNSNFENIIIANNTMFDIQDLLKKSLIMITDYSSVFFDFAYMNKPVIYYQFDEEKFRKLQYKEGKFSYKNNGFGPVFDDKEKVVEYIINRANNNFEMENMYIKRTEAFFKYRDQNNTKRNVEAIIALDNEI